MTGNLMTLKALQNLSGFYLYTNTGKIKIDLLKVKFKELVNYKRRVLMYPYLPREDEDPMAVGYFEEFNVIRVFIPRNVIKITPIDLNGNEVEKTEGVFYDITDPTSLLEYNVDKYITLLESNAGEDLKNYYITIHENYRFDGHREEFELLSKNFQTNSIVNKYLIELFYSKRLLDQLNNTVISPDCSMAYIGTPIKFKNREDIKTLDSGLKFFGNFMKNDFSLNYMGGLINNGDYVNINSSKINYYTKWTGDTTEAQNKKWDSFRWAPENIQSEPKRITFIRCISKTYKDTIIEFYNNPDDKITIEGEGVINIIPNEVVKVKTKISYNNSNPENYNKFIIDYKNNSLELKFA